MSIDHNNDDDATIANFGNAPIKPLTTVHQLAQQPKEKFVPSHLAPTNSGASAEINVPIVRTARPNPVELATQASIGDAGEESAKEQTLELGVGALVEQYEIIKELGRGGMGQVFMARDTKLGRVVAIKFLTRTGDAFIRRFLVEAQTTAQCTHENIVVIHEANTFHGHPYMVLEYLDGMPLSKAIKGRILAPARTVELMVPVVRALTRAHAFGIVHRDLKPDNIFISSSGTVKVLDFGVAKLFGDEGDPISVNSKLAPLMSSSLYDTLSTGGRVVGTLPFMSPEQFGQGSVDERTDLYAVGVIMFRMLSGQHPLSEVSNATLMMAAAELDVPSRSLADVAPNVPDALSRVVDRCLRKRKLERYGTAVELLNDLEALLPTKHGRRLGAQECPYPGLSAFEEGDSDRYFGRSREVTRAVGLLRDNALLAIVGPSGAGKSSFVRAGVIPELKSSGVHWETFIIRPGRDPLSAITTLVENITGKQVDQPALVSRLRHEPGYLGQLLRNRARQKKARTMLMIDQFEELYTLVPSEDERHIFTQILHGVADEPGSPLRLVLSFRSDFLHRIAENAAFADSVMHGLLLLGPPDKEGLREAIVGPAEKADYRFESPQMVDELLGELKSSSAPYPLMQFCLANLWAQRNTRSQILPYEAFRQMGGVAGALAGHADQIISTLSHGAQKVARTMFQRLVTSEGTRAIVDLDEISSTSSNPAEVQRVLSAFVDARLLVMHQDTKTVEIVHEALVAQWPTLRRWMEEGREDVAFIEQVRAAARQWDSNDRPNGLLWQGAPAKDAQRFMDRFGASLAAKEREFLRAVIDLDIRAGRRRNVVVGGIIAVLVVMVAASVIGLVMIRGAKARATQLAIQAQTESKKSKQAEAKAEAALIEVTTTQGKLDQSQGDLAAKNAALLREVDQATAATAEAQKQSAIAQAALAEAQAAKAEAQKAAADALAAKKQADALAASEKQRADQLAKKRADVVPI